MRGGTSKGVFFKLEDLPKFAQVAGKERDELLLRVIGSPDPYGKHTDGMGGATSSTSKVVILSSSNKSGHDVDYLFGQVAIDKPFIDWSGNCGNLSAAVGSFAINSGLISPKDIPQNGVATVRIWQANIGKTIVAHVPIINGCVQEAGDFELDGVTFPSAETPLTFVRPGSDGALFPTGNLIDQLEIPQIGNLQASLINAGIPTIFILAHELGLTGIEGQEEINNNALLLEKFEKIRAYGAVKMGLIQHIEEAQTRQHTPKVAFISPAKDYVSSSGHQVLAKDINLNIRALSMGKLHHAMMGTAAVAIGAAAAIPNTLVNKTLKGESSDKVCFGHPSGTLTVGAEAKRINGEWSIDSVTMSRSARVLMDGWVYVVL